AAAKLYLEIGGVQLLKFNMAGFILISSQGFAAAFILELEIDFPLGFAFDFSASTVFRVEINFTGQELYVGSINAMPAFQLPGGRPYARIYIFGERRSSLANGAVAAFRFVGLMYVELTFNATSFLPEKFSLVMNVTAYISLA